MGEEIEIDLVLLARMTQNKGKEQQRDEILDPLPPEE